MRIFTRTLIIAFLGLTFAGSPLAGQQATPAPALLPLSDAIVAKLPPDWRDMAQHIKASETEQKRYLTLTDVVFRQTVALVLTRNHVADAFIKTQLVNDPAPAVRSAIVTAISNDARWNTFADTPGLIEGVAARDPDVAVSLTALELLRRNRIRETG